ncbi:SDR family oxidoreductase [Paramicrobacterium sp. CJ85]|uniref:SDR family oxidoreductase n=1 Tax=Paramicrobacterium sp. CJ85 TaxID=3445355 RepID=UPI003F5D89F4
MSTVLVIGGTGLIGRAVAAEAVRRGHAVRSLSRRVPASGAAEYVEGVDYRECDLYKSKPGEIDAHLDGVDAVIDCVNGVSHVAQAVFRVSAAQLTDAAMRANISRAVVVSDVGCDQSDFAYYEAKTDQEGVYLDSRIPTTVVRFTVLYEQMLEHVTTAARYRIIPTSSRARLQPIDVADIAPLIVDAIDDEGEDTIRSYGGPEIGTVREFTQQWLQYTGRSALLLPVPLITAIGRYLRSGVNLAPNSRAGTITWQQWLAQSGTPPQASASCAGDPHAPRTA